MISGSLFCWVRYFGWLLNISFDLNRALVWWRKTDGIEHGQMKIHNTGQHKNVCKMFMAFWMSDNQVTEIDTSETTSKNRLNYQIVTDILDIWSLNTEAWRKIIWNKTIRLEQTQYTFFWIHISPLTVSVHLDSKAHDSYRIFTLTSTNRQNQQVLFYLRFYRI